MDTSGGCNTAARNLLVFHQARCHVNCMGRNKFCWNLFGMDLMIPSFKSLAREKEDNLLVFNLNSYPSLT